MLATMCRTNAGATMQYCRLVSLVVANQGPSPGFQANQEFRTEPIFLMYRDETLSRFLLVV